MFVNGCYPNILPHPYRYRVLNQIEQLNADFLESIEIFYLKLNYLIVRDFRIIIFYRCPWTEEVDKAIRLAKKLNKKVLFDIDDLVIDTKYTNLISYIHENLSLSEKKLYNDGVIRIGKTLRLCQGAITTTEMLAKELKKYVPVVFINPNTASEEMLKLSEIALEKKSKQKKKKEIIIGYYSGSITHNEDIKMIIPSFVKILKEFKHIKLFFQGEINIPIELKQFSSKIYIKPFISWKKLPQLISRVDINIAPIKKSIFNEAKSGNKWLEAALVKVPTIASKIGVYKKIINNYETGILCSSNEEWYNAFKNLIINETLRNNIANKAYEISKVKHNSLGNGAKLSNFIN